MSRAVCVFMYFGVLLVTPLSSSLSTIRFILHVPHFLVQAFGSSVSGRILNNDKK
jgi:hypothetical protein